MANANHHYVHFFDRKNALTGLYFFIFQYLSLYISSLMHWCPHEFKRQHVGFIAHVLLRDAHVDPEWVFSHNPQTIAVVCLSLAMRITQVWLLLYLRAKHTAHRINRPLERISTNRHTG